MTKSDRSPVTQADIAAEGILRQELLGAFPDDGFLGEETGSTAGSSGYEWVVDPIDGTKSFIRGVPLWATLVGCRRGDEGILGVIAVPALDEMVYAAVGGGAWHVRGGAAPTPARASGALSTRGASCSPRRAARRAAILMPASANSSAKSFPSPSTNSTFSRRSIPPGMPKKSSRRNSTGRCSASTTAAAPA
jgi:fructose-1,6-bisphosphatase/inositol monophosphatase family enzyme